LKIFLSGLDLVTEPHEYNWVVLDQEVATLLMKSTLSRFNGGRKSTLLDFDGA
jgi:hypothetical protein